MSRRNELILAIAFVAFLTLFWVEWRAEARFVREDLTTMAFLDVGQGDATLLRTPEGETALIDAGPGDRVREALERRLPSWERELDLVVITHLDADHFTGLFALLDAYRIGEVLWSGAAPETLRARRLVEELFRRGIPVRAVKSGDAFPFGDLNFEVVHPDEALSGAFLADRNAGSVSMTASCGDDLALLAGDAPSETEEDMLEDGDLGDLTVLKVSHHGSKHSTSGTFLDATTPEYAVISSGRGNRYGHPALRVLTALRTRGIDIFRTDEMGDIVFGCDGERLAPL